MQSVVIGSASSMLVVDSYHSGEKLREVYAHGGPMSTHTFIFKTSP